MTEEFYILRKRMIDYLAGKLTGKEIVKSIDDFVSNDHVYDLPEIMSEKVMTLQDEVAYYVPDPIMRKEHSSYIGDEKLHALISQFFNQVKIHN